MSPAPVRLGLIGAGRWGRNIIRTTGESRGAALARVASRNPETRRLVPPNCAVDADWRRVVDDPTLEGVILAVPPRVQPSIVGSAIAAGRPVMVEKPLALSVAEAEDIERRAQAARVAVLVDHVYLFHPAWAALVGLSRQAGRLRRIRAIGGGLGPFRNDCPVLWDWAPHDVAMCLDLIGTAPDRVAARRLRTARTEHGTGEILALDLGFGDATAEIEIGNVMATRVRRFEAVYDETTLVFDDAASEPLIQNGAPVRIAVRPPLACAIDAFVDGIRSRATNHPSLALGVEVVKAIARCDAALPPAAT